RKLARAGLLDQDVLVEDPDRARSHQLLRDARGGALEHEATILGDARPVAVVADETAGAAGGRVDALVGSGLPEIALDARPQRLNPIAKIALEQHRAVEPETLDQVLRDGRRRARARLFLHGGHCWHLLPVPWPEVWHRGGASSRRSTRARFDHRG